MQSSESFNMAVLQRVKSTQISHSHRILLTQESWGTPRCSGAWPDPPPVMEPMLVGTRRMPSKQVICSAPFSILVVQHESESYPAINAMWESDVWAFRLQICI